MTGNCEDETEVPCPGGAPPGAASCVGVIAGDIEDPTACNQFYQCFNEVQTGPFSCSRDDLFNPATSRCDPAGVRDPPCTTRGVRHYTKVAPAVEWSLKEKIMRRLHL